MDTLWISAFLCLCIEYVNISMMQVAGLVTTIRYQEGNAVNISCLGTSKFQIQNITVQEEETTCRRKPCILNYSDRQTIKNNCNGGNSCLVDYNFTSTCLREFRYLNLSYTCKHENRESLSTFEVDFGDWIVVLSNRTTWERNAFLTDHTRVKTNARGYSLSAISYYSAAGTCTARIVTDKELMEPICLSLWYQFYTNAYDCYFKIYKISGGNDTLLYTANGNHTFHNTWINISVDVYGQDPFKIVLEADFNLSLFVGIRAILIDDTSIAYRPCKGHKIDTTCLDIEKPITIQCKTPLLGGDISVSLEPENLISQQNTCTENSIESKLNSFCSNFNKSDQCEFNILDVMNGYQDCFVTRKTITVTYLCSDLPSGSMESSTPSYVSAAIPMYTIIVSILVVVVIAVLVFIVVVFYRKRKKAINSKPCAIQKNNQINTDRIYFSNSNIDKTTNTIVYENVIDDTTITREPQVITSSIQQTGNTYESLSSNRNSMDQMYESTKRVSKVTDLSQYQSLTNPTESDIHNYESTKRDTTQYQSLTIPHESDIHTYDSTDLELSQYQSLANPPESDIHTYASTTSIQ